MRNAEFADLVVSLTRHNAGLYAVEIQFTQPWSSGAGDFLQVLRGRLEGTVT